MYGTIACIPQKQSFGGVFTHNIIDKGIRLHEKLVSGHRRKIRVASLAILIILLILLVSELPACTSLQKRQTPTPAPFVPGGVPPGGSTIIPPTLPGAGPVIHDVTLNTGQYPGGRVPRYEKLEITFRVDTSASNLQLPFDPSPPPGIQPGVGISVDALFTPDNWQTTYRLPAFYYQDFEDSVKSNQEWLYPTEDHSWKVRFAPNVSGSWQFKLAAQDASGLAETAPVSFSVIESGSKGFIQVSESDTRYFEFEDGAYFPALGYNMNYDHVSWTNPVLDNQANFQEMGENGIQLARVWLSQWGIFGASWNPWNAIDPAMHGLYIPYTGLTFSEPYSGSETSLRLEATKNPCMFVGSMKARPAVLANSRYRVRIRYRTQNLAGPRASGLPYGLVAKTGDWLWGPGNTCQDAGSGQTVTPYQPQVSGDWAILEGSLQTGNTNFLPLFYLVVENVTAGRADVDYVWIEQDLGNGQYGPNIISKPWMSHHLYFEQRNSYAFDEVLNLAEENGVYLRLVVLEKNDWIFNRIDELGQPITYDPLCDDQDPHNDPQRCPGNNWFYGQRRTLTKMRWLHQAWWRYLQARWGYSTNIHSWELLNEGDPASELHFTMADEFGKYMHQFVPNDHLVSTSNWHSFPKDAFWANANYPDVDFADIHLYVAENSSSFVDTAAASSNPSMQFGAKRPGGAGKPVIRGETGFVVSGTEPQSDQMLSDVDGIWLHNFLWAGINPGGLIESYWYEKGHIYSTRPNGDIIFDHRPQFRSLYNFLKDLALNNGNYQDARASATNSHLRVLGQKDLANGRAHLWILNANHTWKNVVDGVPVAAISAAIRIEGFQPGQQYTLQWWDTDQPDPARQILSLENITAASDGSLSFQVNNLRADIAVQIAPESQSGSSFVLFLPTVVSRPVVRPPDG